LAIASGKGGTGKTTVAVNMALSLDNAQLLDCDVEEPNAHLFLDLDFDRTEDVETRVPRIDIDKCDTCKKCAKFCEFNALAIFSNKVMVFDELCHGCGGCAIICPQDAVTFVPKKLGVLDTGRVDGLELVRGKIEIGVATATPVVVAVKGKVREEGPVIIDVSPGAGCPVVESLTDVDYCILVTEPTPFGLHDLKIGVEVCRALDLDFGIVINRDGVGDDGVERYAEDEGIDILMRIPQDMEIARLYSKGVPFVKAMSEWKQRFRDLYERIEGKITAARNGKEVAP
jgi:MinD superfamily P-loop ATPase